MSDPRSMAEKRRSERRRTRLRSGKLVNIDGSFLIECQLHDIAGGGAKIRVADPRAVPDRFWLFDDHYAQALFAEVVWRDGLELGVRFCDDPAIQPLGEARLSKLASKYYSL
ncbi:pilus assembly protein PilZ [Paramesorhizobium deserti]|uniref:Pilus assembly protein PilZ n=1 Tax=Paramesorhizobium deserti TaxID=1494590 RepID=A0A135HS35_9HYPH|nr:PilZ domain-containing protein [Paramesorhizobium deserti]KXF76000.1 pilus assembly protein PilZ [Paramesorhizobium deserti]